MVGARCLSLFLFIAIVTGEVAADCEEIDEILGSCLANSGELDPCLATLIEELRNYMTSGCAKYGIPVTEPMFVPSIDFHLENAAGLNVTVIFTNNEISGLSKFNLNSIHADTSSTPRTLSIEIAAATLKAKGQYDLSGQAFVPLPRSTGNYNSIFSNVVINGVSQLENVNGRLEIVGDPTLDIQLGDMNIKFENLFVKNNLTHLANLVDKFVNDDPRKFFEEFKPQITPQIAVLMKGFVLGAIRSIVPSVFNL